jgi:hypothetical protein
MFGWSRRRRDKNATCGGMKEINGLFWLDKPVLAGSECRAHRRH